MSTQIAVVNLSKLPDDYVAFAVKGIDMALAEVTDAWGLARMAVVFYAAGQLPASDAWLLEVVDTMDVPSALGYHQDDGLPSARVLAQDSGTDVTIAHEVFEMVVDPTCGAWKDKGDGTSYAQEVSDPVEGDSFPVQVTISGEPPETRTVQVSNWTYPSYFDPAGEKPFDKMGNLSAPFTMDAGGYVVVRDSTGNENEVFARRARVIPGGLLGAAKAWEKYRKPEGRLSRRLRG